MKSIYIDGMLVELEDEQMETLKVWADVPSWGRNVFVKFLMEKGIKQESIELTPAEKILYEAKFMKDMEKVFEQLRNGH